MGSSWRSRTRDGSAVVSLEEEPVLHSSEPRSRARKNLQLGLDLEAYLASLIAQGG